VSPQKVDAGENDQPGNQEDVQEVFLPCDPHHEESKQQAAGNRAELLKQLCSSDPASGTFRSTGSLTTATGYQTAALLNNGMVLVAGGHSNSAYYMANAELYDTATAAFTNTGSLNFARYLQTETLLNNGMVLVVGGYGASPNYRLAIDELYEPATLTPPTLVSITVAPTTSTLSAGTTRRFIATGTFSDNSTQQLASVTWSSSDSTLAQISNDASNHGMGLAVAPELSPFRPPLEASAARRR
jgi:hypothetical protein